LAAAALVYAVPVAIRSKWPLDATIGRRSPWARLSTSIGDRHLISMLVT
jgi:hypothetical protein